MKHNIFLRTVSVVLSLVIVMTITSPAIASERTLTNQLNIEFVDENSFLLDGVLFVTELNENGLYVLTLYQDSQVLERVTTQFGEDWLLHEDYRDAVATRDGKQLPTTTMLNISDYVTTEAVGYFAVQPFEPGVWRNLGAVRYETTFGIRTLTFRAENWRTVNHPNQTISVRVNDSAASVIALVASSLARWILHLVGGPLTALAANIVAGLTGIAAGGIFTFATTIQLFNARVRHYNVEGTDPATGRTRIENGRIYHGQGQARDAQGRLQTVTVDPIAHGKDPNFIIRRDIVIAISWFHNFWAENFRVIW